MLKDKENEYLIRKVRKVINHLEMNKRRTGFWPCVLLMHGAAGGAGTADMTYADECDENGKKQS